MNAQQLLNTDLLADLTPGPVGVAVSGGSDSVATLLLIQEWAKDAGREIVAATVDHGLRAESGAEAEWVAALCQRIGIGHTTLPLTGRLGGNVQKSARDARYRELADWGVQQGCAAIALGHTADDLAETFLQRLTRGSGVDGLAAMQAWFERNGVYWIRPVLDTEREDLRAYLLARSQNWLDDPSNLDPRYDRVRIRQAMAQLEKLGLTRPRIVDTANAMRRASQSLRRIALKTARQIISTNRLGEVRIDRETIFAEEDEITFRLVSAALQWVSGAEYRPRFKALADNAAGLRMGDDFTLHGCLVRVEGDCIVIRREPGAVEASKHAEACLWDNRWVIEPKSTEPGDLTLAALGENGLKQLENWRETGFVREALLTLPAIWNRDELLEVPLLSDTSTWQCRLARPPEALYESIGPVESG